MRDLKDGEETRKATFTGYNPEFRPVELIVSSGPRNQLDGTNFQLKIRILSRGYVPAPRECFTAVLSSSHLPLKRTVVDWAKKRELL